MSESAPNSGGAKRDATLAYVLGHSPQEIDRLKLQARRIDPITRRFFESAGIQEGMRVLDVGSGAGDVAILVADLVGSTGSVLGVDRSADAIEEARRRSGALALSQVAFRVGDPAQMPFEHQFDAIVGRYVLQFQRDPSAMLRQLVTLARPGGLVVFHELDWGGLGSFPAVPTFDRCSRWGAETLRLHGTEMRMGAKLHATFVSAGLAAPTMRLEAAVGGGDQAVDVLTAMARVIETLLPEMERLGVATASEVGIDTVVQRMRAEAASSESIVIGHSQYGAWSRI